MASADVLSSLVRNNPGAFMKYALITLLQLCLELMPILLKLQAGQSPLGHRMAIFAYDNKTRALAQVNQSAARRLDADAQIALARHEHALVDKEQYAVRQEVDSNVTKQKLIQDLENEKIRQELEELKRQSNAYLRAQHQFTQSFSQASGQFVNRVVMPAMATVSKPFAAKSSNEANVSTASSSESAVGAKVYPFGISPDLGAKAAS